MTTAQTDTSQAADHKEKGPSPFLRAISKGGDGAYAGVLSLWAHAEGAKTHMHGYVVTEGKKEQVIGFFNDKDGKKSIALKKFVEGAEGAEGTWATLGYGNAVNTNKNNDTVFFDTVVFNVSGQTIGARVTGATDQALRDKIGFTSAQVERPTKTAEGDSAAETAVATDRPRG